MSGFGDEFLWGTATSSHQVEGAQHNDWTDWEAQPGRIHDGTRSGDAAGWWGGEAEKDLARAAALGTNAHRMSLEWSRLEPAPGRFDPRAFERYRAILGAGRAAGLRMLVTLNHFTLPRWAARGGSWLDRELPERFALYARRCAEELGEHVDLWATLNEPAVLAFMGYLGDDWPPGVGDPRAAFRAIAAQLEAHARASAALRAVTVAPVGLVLNLPFFEPARPRHPLDRLAAKGQDWAFSGAKLAAVEDGLLRLPLPPQRVPGLAGSVDWLGLNYYGRYAVRFDPRAPAQAFGRRVQEGSVKTEHNDWGEPCARGMAAQLRRMGRLGVPLMVTENGMYDPSDTRRPGFLRDHVEAVRQVRREGVDVRGYFVWSLVDNFEWAEGWMTPFGLFGLDRETQERTRRASADAYAALIAEGA